MRTRTRTRAPQKGRRRERQFSRFLESSLLAMRGGGGEADATGASCAHRTGKCRESRGVCRHLTGKPLSKLVRGDLSLNQTVTADSLTAANCGSLILKIT